MGITRKRTRKSFKVTSIINGKKTKTWTTLYSKGKDHFSKTYQEQQPTPVDDLSTSSNGQHQTRKIKEISNWQNLQQSIDIAAIESEYPQSFCCASCQNSTTSIIRCLDCGPHIYFCGDCCIRHHQITLFHHLEQWCEETMSYQPFNMDIQLNLTRHACEHTYEKTLIIVANDGTQHKTRAQFCQCQEEVPALIYHGFWPSSPSKPVVALTFTFMENLKASVMECQISVRSYCESLKWRHENKFLQIHIRSLYKTISGECFEEFRHFHARKGNLQKVAPSLIKGTECPLCPTESERSTTSERLILSLDGNFGLVRRKKAGVSGKSPNNTNLLFLDQDHVDRFVDNYRMSANDKGCSNFQAGGDEGSKSKNNKLDETAVFGAACRHEFPHMFFSLKHGERISYAVFMLMTIVERQPGNTIILYDIACTLDRHLQNNTKYQHLRDDVQFGIPVFHCHGHRLKCQILYSPRKMTGIGLTDGETMERLWSYLRRFKHITKEMSADHRVDLLTDGLLHYAKRLKSKIANHLCEKYKRALDTRREHEEELQRTMNSIQGATSQDVMKWRNDQKKSVNSTTVTTKSDWKEGYVLSLHELNLTKNQETVEANEIERASLHTKKLRLENDIKAMEKKYPVTKQWSEDTISDMIQVQLEAEQTKELDTIRSLVFERQCHLRSIRRYADGQSLYKKYAKLTKRVNNQLHQHIGQYNLLSTPKTPNLPSTLSFDEVTDAKFCHFQAPKSIEVDGMRKQCIDHSDMVNRAGEEIGMIKTEMSRYLKRVQKLSEDLFSLIQNSHNQTLFELGKIVVLKRSLSVNLIVLQELTSKFSPFVDTASAELFIASHQQTKEEFALIQDLSSDEDDILSSSEENDSDDDI